MADKNLAPSAPPVTADSPPDVETVKSHKDSSGNRWIVTPVGQRVEVYITTPSGHQAGGTYDSAREGMAFLRKFVAAPPEPEDPHDPA